VVCFSALCQIESLVAFVPRLFRIADRENEGKNHRHFIYACWLFFLRHSFLSLFLADARNIYNCRFQRSCQERRNRLSLFISWSLRGSVFLFYCRVRFLWSFCHTVRVIVILVDVHYYCWRGAYFLFWVRVNNPVFMNRSLTYTIQITDYALRDIYFWE